MSPLNYDDSMPQPEEASETPAVSHKKKSKTVILLAAIAAVVLCAALVICGIFFGWFSSKTPFEKTMDAVFPTFELIDSMEKNGGKVTFEGRIASDLADGLGRNPLFVSANYAFGKNGAMIEAAFGAEDDLLDVGAIFDEKGAQLYSDRLLGDQGYSIAYNGLMDAIDDSPFAPDSGTKYAMSQELYDVLDTVIEYAESGDTAESTAMTDAMNAILEEMKKTITVSKEKTNVALTDGDAQATVYTATFNEEILIAFIDAFVYQWNNNDEFYDEIRSYLEIIASSQEDPSEWVSQQMNQLNTILTDGMDEIKDSITDGMLDGCFKYAVRSGYLVYIETDVVLELDGEDIGLNFTWAFSKAPKKDQNYDVKLSFTENGEDKLILSLSYRNDDKEDEASAILEFFAFDDPESSAARIDLTWQKQDDDRFTMNVDLKSAEFEGSFDESKYTTDFSLELGGICVKKQSSIDLTLDSIVVISDNGYKEFKMDRSTFRIFLENKQPSIDRKENDKEILKLSARELDELIQGVTDKIPEIAESINSSLDYSLFKNAYSLSETRSLGLSSAAIDYAIDRETGHLFVVNSSGTASQIVMYDLNTMEELDSLRLDDVVHAIDADGGNLAFCFTETYGETYAYIYDAETLEHVRTVKYNTMYNLMDQDYPGDLVLDGDNLIFATGNQHCEIFLTDVNTEKTTRFSNTYYYCSLAIDRKNHTLGINESGSSGCNFAIYNSLTGECIHSFDTYYSYNYDPVYFDGYAFQSYGKHFTNDGKYQEIGNSMVDVINSEYNEYTILALIYKDDNMIATLESDEAENIYTSFYLPDGYLFERLNTVVYSIENIGDGEYLALVYDGIETSLICYEASTVWKLGG